MPQQQQNEEYLDYLADAFITEAKKENDKLAIAALAAGATVWGLSGNMIAGIALGGCILLYSDRSVRASNRALLAIEKTQIAAPFLKGNSFNDFRRKFGEEFTLNQLRQAHEYGLPMQPDAEDYLLKQCPELTGKEPDKPLAALPEAVSSTADTLPVTDIAEIMGRLLKPTIISALPRSGKGVLLANAWRSAKRHHPDLKVFVIDPKAHPDESGYWAGCDRVLAKRFDQIPVNDADTISEVEAFIDEWRNDPAPKKLLIFDEQILVDSKLPKWAKENIPALAKSESSAGETWQRYLWLVMQSPLVKDIGLSGGSRSIFAFCAIATNRPVEGMNPAAWMKSAKASDFIPSIPTDEQFQNSPRGVLCHSSLVGNWAAMPEYPVPKPVALAPAAISSNLFQPIQPPAVSANLLQPIQQAVVSPNFNQPIEQPQVMETKQPKKQAQNALQEQYERVRFAITDLPELAQQLKDYKPIFQKLMNEQRKDLVTIALFSMEHGGIRAKDVYNHAPSRRKLFHPIKTEGIRQLFEELETRGIGEVIGDDPDAFYTAFFKDDRSFSANSKSDDGIAL